MKTIIEITDASLLNEAQEWLRQMKAEHGEYYKHAPFRVQSVCPIGPEVPDTSESGYYAGYSEVPGGGRWLTSGGNYTAIVRKERNATVFLDGRRHGVRWPFEVEGLSYDPNTREIVREGRVVGRVLAYNSQRSDTAPWEMGL